MTMLTAPKGMNDVLPGAGTAFLSSAVWTQLQAVAEATFRAHGYAQIWLPLVEETALFTRGIGAGTDIVAKEMYSFTDRGNRAISLRPEGTAGAARAYIEHGFGRHEPLQRWWYMGPMFRAERPQKGRYRQFYQIGAELFGAPEGVADAEMLLLGCALCRALGIEGVQVRLNSLGDASSRIAYREVLLAYLAQHQAALCASCQGRVQSNPLRVLDCKRPSCIALVVDAPDILASLTPTARRGLACVEALLQEAGQPFTRDPRLVRGLDYYTGIIFELTSANLGAQDAILGGGRYDQLVQDLAGPATPAVGFAAGVERLALILAAQATAPAVVGPALYLAPVDPTAAGLALALAVALREQGLGVMLDVLGGRLKQQLRRAEKAGAAFVMVLGESELAAGRGRLRRLASGEEVETALTPAAIAAQLAAGQPS